MKVAAHLESYDPFSIKGGATQLVACSDHMVLDRHDRSPPPSTHVGVHRGRRNRGSPCYTRTRSCAQCVCVCPALSVAGRSNSV
jgi:hypothetical protein